MKPLDQEQFESVRQDLLIVLPRLHRYARNLSGNAADAEDLLQATSERVLSRWHQFRPGSDFDRWAFTIMHSIRKNLLRSEAVRLGHGHEDAEQTLAAPESQSPERNKIHQQVFERLQALPEKQRQVMMLVYVEGFSYSAAAEILKIPIGTVMSRIGRARIKLAAELNSSNEKLASRPAQAQSLHLASTKLTGERAGSSISSSDKSGASSQQAGGSFSTVV